MKFKKLASAVAVASMLFASAVPAVAADRAAGIPDVVVDGKKVEFADQTAVIVDGRTLVPARGVFEAMKCVVEWDEVNSEVTVTSEAKATVVKLRIDSDIMEVVKEDETKNVTLEVPAQLMNARTMIPLRAVAEALGCVIVWSDSAFAANITSNGMISSEDFNSIINSILTGKKMNIDEAVEKGKLALSLYTEAEDVNAGDEFDVFVKLHNVAETYKCTGVVLELAYDRTKFEYIPGSATMVSSDGSDCDRDDVTENLVHETGLRVLGDDILGQEIGEEGYIFKVKLKALSDEGGNIAMVSQLVSGRGYTTSLLLSEDCIVDEVFEGNDLYVDTTGFDLK